MLKNRSLYRTLIIVTVILLFVMTFMCDPLKENYSMLSSDPKGHLLVLVLTVLLGFDIANVTYIMNRRFFPIALSGPLLSAVFPYTAGSGDMFSGLHEILAYVSFAVTVMMTFLNLWKYSFYDQARGRKLMQVFMVILTVDAFMFMETMGAVAIEQFILLSTVVLIHYYLYRQYARL